MIVRSYSSEFGTCPCSGHYADRIVEVRMRVRDETVVLTGVPQGACPNCGSRVYKTMVLRALETLMRSGH